MTSGDKHVCVSGFKNLKQQHYDEHEHQQLNLYHLDHEEERMLRKKKIRKTFSYEEFCLEELGSGDEGSKDEFEAKEASMKDTQYVVIDPDKGIVLGSGDKGSKDEVVANQPAKECTQCVVAYPDKGNMVGSGDEGSKHEVEAKEPAKEDTECASTEPDKGKKTVSPVPSHISISSYTSSAEERMGVDSQVANSHALNEWKWTRLIKNARKIRKDVFQFPASVIKKYFTEPHSSIIIYGSGMCESYPCKLKTHKDPYKMEMYICKGWYEFAEARCLGKGDILKFTIEYPPASCLSVSVDKN
ncbi:unnamed protein product [Vicia faba]|uniref:TF-B3 domain-containing protein n=1 Tax=Vicia faba TaxID=3906 RepID=A0AAV0Z521_VICFA|nr:unnamed protein product [Vicia faba]